MRSLVALLPVLWFALAFSAHRGWSRLRRATPDWRRSLLAASIAGGVLVAASTEVLGALRLFAFGPLAAFWAMAVALTAFVRLRIAKRDDGKPEAFLPPRLGSAELLLLGGIASVLFLVGVTAWAAAPNSWDAVTYHLPRASHWIQNGSVAHYPTHVLRQLFLPTWSEFAIAQGMILAGSDRFANFVQWLSLCGSAVGVSLIARELGGEARAQLAAALLALTLPMAILQGSSAQNDLAVGFWLVCFVYYLLALSRKEEDFRRGDLAVPPNSPGPLRGLLAAAASLGLACLTKPTAYLYALPYVLFAAVLLAARARARFWRQALAPVAVVAALNFGHLARNQTLFGSPLGPRTGAENEAFTPALLISNVSRNLALHLAALEVSWNGFVEKAVLGLHAAMRADASDPRTTWRGRRFHVPASLSGEATRDKDEILYLLLHEGFAGNLLHLLLILCLLASIASRGSWRERRPLVSYTLLATAAFALFCAALKWQPWHARLHLPLFLLWCPAIAVFLFAKARLGGWVCVLLFLFALPWVFLNATRPLVGPESVLRTDRFSQYFQNRPELESPFLTAARALSSDRCPVGLTIGPDDGEYLLWMALSEAGQGGRRLEHVNVANISRETARPQPPGTEPCGFLTLGPPGVIRVSGSEGGTRVIAIE